MTKRIGVFDPTQAILARRCGVDLLSRDQVFDRDGLRR
jgi:hypothetical protein